MHVKFLVIGHITLDRTPTGFRLGGTVSYAAATAKRLGLHPGILTRGSSTGLIPQTIHGAPENVAAPPGSDLDGVSIHLLPSPVSTTFSNLYRDGQRTQILETQAGSISPSELPANWADVPMVLLGPLDRELSPGWVTAFPQAMVGITPQGWMRQWDAAGHVRPARWEDAEEFLRRADVVILSREDVGSDDAYIADLAQQTRLLVVTDGWHPATLHQAGTSYRIPARSTQEVDPTGAGDVFAAAFLIRLAETNDPPASARFATVVASMSVEGPGMAAIPDRARVNDWLMNHV